MLNSLIYVGVAGDRRTTFVDFDLGAGDADGRAHDLLKEHRSCDHVEIWRDEHCIAVIGRAKSGVTV